MPNVDFSEQIEDFRSAKYGEDVRDSLIDIAEAVETAINNQLITVDDTLTETGQGADAAAVGDAIGELRSSISSSQGMSAEFKVALETLLSNVAYKGNDPTGHTYIDALHTAMYPPANLSSISAVYTQSGTVYNTDTLESLKADLVVTAHYDNGTTEIVTAYTLSGSLDSTTSTITVSYGGKTTTFTVNVAVGIDVTPDFSSFTTNNSTKEVSDDTMRLYCSGKTYAGAYARFTMEEGYTYRIYADAEIIAGKAKIYFTPDANNASVVSGYSTPTISESGHLDLAVDYNSNVGRLYMICTWTSAENGNVTYSNFKIVKYLTE